MTDLSVLEHIQATSKPVSAVLSGTLREWHVAPGQDLAFLDRLGILATDEGDIEITTPAAGRLSALMFRPGDKIDAGAALAYVRLPGPPPHVGEARPRLVLRRGSLGPLGRPAAAVGSPNGLGTQPRAPAHVSGPNAAIGAAAAADRRAIAPQSLGLGANDRPQISSERPQKKRTKRHTYHLEEGQIEAIRRLALKLNLQGDATIRASESELVRVALAMLLDLPRPALVEMIRANKSREQAGKYGSGFPRPRKP
jgi:pyruvate/2-oxoglutarate dehydrogenase complex dihydrolipoamide acyltransferase (E2) component